MPSAPRMLGNVDSNPNNLMLASCLGFRTTPRPLIPVILHLEALYPTHSKP